MLEPTVQQELFITKASPESVLTACPGSGKTHTAVLRFLERCKLTRSYGVAFLSYTNVAVDEASEIAREYGGAGLIGSPNLISTLDAFFRHFVFEPFIRSAIRRVPGEVEILDARPPTAIANDPILKVNGVRSKSTRGRVAKMPLAAWEAEGFLDVNGSLVFDFKVNAFSDEREMLPFSHKSQLLRAKEACLAGGFATYNDILVYCYLLLRTKERRIAEIIARRFREIIVDEAQDTSMLQQSMLEILAAAGSKISYVGDRRQGIYLFSRANPKYLDTLIERGHEAHTLDVNFRSIKPIVDVVNKHFKTSMSCQREASHALHGAYVFVGTPAEAMSAFEAFLCKADISRERAAVLVRKRSHLGRALATRDTKGWRAIPRLAVEALQRERRHDTEGALRAAVQLIKESAARDAVSSLDATRLRELAWCFLRGREFPQPSSEESPQEWCMRLKAALQQYLDSKGLQLHENFSARAGKSGLSDKGSALDELSFERPVLRTTVVHQVKGETISAVLIIAPEDQHDAWLETDPDEEEKNVCYVAFTRAADLLVLHCPSEAHAMIWRERGFCTLLNEEAAKV